MVATDPGAMFSMLAGGRSLLSRPGHEEHNQPLLDAPVHVLALPRVRGLRCSVAHT